MDINRQRRELLELRSRLEKKPEALKSSVRATGLRIVAVPIKEKKQRTPEEIKARKEYFDKKNKEPLTQNLSEQLKGFKAA